MADRIDSVEARTKLKPRRAPYWHRLSTGCHVGFRKMAPGSEGTWLAQTYDAATQKQTRKSLGTFDHLQPGQRFDAAKKAAESLTEHLQHGGSADDLTVKEACKQYVKHLRSEGKAATADDAEARFRRLIDDDKLGRIAMRKLATHHIRDWRRALLARPVTINPHADEADRKTRKRSASSVNRDMTALRAALNHAQENGAVATNAAWHVALRPIDSADGRRMGFLDFKQRGALIAKAPADLALFLRGLSMVPLRPGALASLTAGSYDKRLSVLTIGKDKAGKDRGIKLSGKVAEFFAGLTTDKLPTAPLFARADGKAWDKDAWKKPIKAAAEAAELPASTTAYTVRHSVITDLIVGGLDTLTVARLSGTSLPMIEKHYGHLRGEHAAKALEALAI
jgi:site-specific recombinase XerD